MGKGAPVLTNSLYKISDKIAQATVNKPAEGQDPQSAGETPRAAAPKLLPAERVLEFNRMYHDLEIRVEGMLAEYGAETALLDERKNEITAAAAQIETLKKELQETTLPADGEENAERLLSKRLRAMELMRLETIRISKKTEVSGRNGNAPAENRENGPSLSSITGGELMKKGFAFFFPLGLTLVICTILLGLAFIVAWKVAL